MVVVVAALEPPNDIDMVDAEPNGLGVDPKEVPVPELFPNGVALLLPAPNALGIAGVPPNPPAAPKEKAAAVTDGFSGAEAIEDEGNEEDIFIEAAGAAKVKVVLSESFFCSEALAVTA